MPLTSIETCELLALELTVEKPIISKSGARPIDSL